MEIGRGSGCFVPALDALGGKLNPGETWREAAVREVIEETGGLLSPAALNHMRACIMGKSRWGTLDGKSVFTFYDPGEYKGEWYQLKGSYTERFRGSSTRERSVQKLHLATLEENLFTSERPFKHGHGTKAEAVACAARRMPQCTHNSLPCGARRNSDGRLECSLMGTVLPFKPHVEAVLRGFFPNHLRKWNQAPAPAAQAGPVELIRKPRQQPPPHPSNELAHSLPMTHSGAEQAQRMSNLISTDPAYQAAYMQRFCYAEPMMPPSLPSHASPTTPFLTLTPDDGKGPSLSSSCPGAKPLGVVESATRPSSSQSCPSSLAVPPPARLSLVPVGLPPPFAPPSCSPPPPASHHASALSLSPPSPSPPLSTPRCRRTLVDDEFFQLALLTDDSGDSDDDTGGIPLRPEDPSSSRESNDNESAEAGEEAWRPDSRGDDTASLPETELADTEAEEEEEAEPAEKVVAPILPAAEASSIVMVPGPQLAASVATSIVSATTSFRLTAFPPSDTRSEDHGWQASLHDGRCSVSKIIVPAREHQRKRRAAAYQGETVRRDRSRREQEEEAVMQICQQEDEQKGIPSLHAKEFTYFTDGEEAEPDDADYLPPAKRRALTRLSATQRMRLPPRAAILSQKAEQRRLLLTGPSQGRASNASSGEAVRGTADMPICID